jgi:hypothetical protein
MLIGRMAIPPCDLTWELPPGPESAGPVRLAELIQSYRDCVRRYRGEHNTGITSLGGLSPAGLSRFIQFAYRASFLTDEGRPTLARLVVTNEHPDGVRKADTSGLPADRHAVVTQNIQRYWQGQEQRLNTVRFSPPQPLDRPAAIAKLSSVLNTYDSAISVAEQGESLLITGLGLLDPAEAERMLFAMPRHFRADAGLVLDILGPGHLRVRDGKITFTLFGDLVTVYDDLLSVGQLRQWLSEFSEELVARLEKHDEYAADSGLLHPYSAVVEQFGKCPHDDVAFAINRILTEAARMRHGGAFAFLPDVPSARNEGHLRDMKYAIAPLDLGEELFEAWLAVSRVWIAMKGHPQLQNVVNAQRLAIHRWLSLLRTVSGMSAADGCVVIDRRLVVHGFGGSINADNVAGGPGRLCQDTTKNQEVRASDLLARFGQRHRSAYALCANVPGSLVFVVSQDGDLRILYLFSGCNSR